LPEEGMQGTGNDNRGSDDVGAELNLGDGDGNDSQEDKFDKFLAAAKNTLLGDASNANKARNTQAQASTASIPSTSPESNPIIQDVSSENTIELSGALTQETSDQRAQDPVQDPVQDPAQDPTQDPAQDPASDVINVLEADPASNSANPDPIKRDINEYFQKAFAIPKDAMYKKADLADIEEDKHADKKRVPPVYSAMKEKNNRGKYVPIMENIGNIVDSVKKYEKNPKFEHPLIFNKPLEEIKGSGPSKHQEHCPQHGINEAVERGKRHSTHRKRRASESSSGSPAPSKDPVESEIHPADKPAPERPAPERHAPEEERPPETHGIRSNVGGVVVIRFQTPENVELPTFYEELDQGVQEYYESFDCRNANVGQACMYLASLYRLFNLHTKADHVEQFAQDKKRGHIRLRSKLSEVNIEAFMSVLKILKMPIAKIINEPTLDHASVLEVSGGKCKDFSDYKSGLKNKLYLPKRTHDLKHFIAQAISNRKMIFNTNEIHHVEVSLDPEFDFVTCFRRWSLFPLITMAIPDVERGTKETSCDRTFFFNIVNTVYPDVVTRLIDRVRQVKERDFSVQAIPINNRRVANQRFVDATSTVVPAAVFVKGACGTVKFKPFNASVEEGEEFFEVSYLGQNIDIPRAESEAVITQIGGKSKRSKPENSENSDNEEEGQSD
jgi:hypothetical protein